MAENKFIVVTEFILLGLTDGAELKIMLFVLNLVIYFITLVGNLGMIFLIQVIIKLHTSMYFFPRCLSFVDACCSSVIAPKMLINFFVVRETISFSSCIVQHLFLGVFITAEGFLLSVMGYDCYVAIVNPFLYFSYIQPSSQYSVEQEKVVFVLYTLVIPMLNPLIYSLRNRDKGCYEKGLGNEASLLLSPSHF